VVQINCGIAEDDRGFATSLDCVLGEVAVLVSVDLAEEGTESAAGVAEDDPAPLVACLVVFFCFLLGFDDSATLPFEDAASTLDSAVWLLEDVASLSLAEMGALALDSAMLALGKTGA
jgi:hypothetical protein